MLLNMFGFLNLSFIDLLDILMVAAILFVIFRWIRGSSAMNIFIAIIFLLIIRVVAVAMNMKMMSALMSTVLDVGVVALIVIFQPEIRRFLNNFGHNARIEKGRNFILEKILNRKSSNMGNEAINDIAEACREMSEQKTGALIVIRHHDSIEEIISTGDVIDAVVSKRLIMNIFFKNSPLHDGAMIIDNDRIISARCTLPITSRADIPASYGMRHKAAIGLSETCDADIIVVSEQTGRISFVHENNVTNVKSTNLLKLLIGGTEEENKE